MTASCSTQTDARGWQKWPLAHMPWRRDGSGRQCGPVVRPATHAAVAPVTLGGEEQLTGGALVGPVPLPQAAPCVLSLLRRGHHRYVPPAVRQTGCCLQESSAGKELGSVGPVGLSLHQGLDVVLFQRPTALTGGDKKEEGAEEEDTHRQSDPRRRRGGRALAFKVANNLSRGRGVRIRRGSGTRTASGFACPPALSYRSGQQQAHGSSSQSSSGTRPTCTQGADHAIPGGRAPVDGQPRAVTDSMARTERGCTQKWAGTRFTQRHPTRDAGSVLPSTGGLTCGARCTPHGRQRGFTISCRHCRRRVCHAVRPASHHGLGTPSHARLGEQRPGRQCCATYLHRYRSLPARSVLLGVWEHHRDGLNVAQATTGEVGSECVIVGE